MKLQKLYTLSQFVDLMMIHQEESVNNSQFYLEKIIWYNDFLKQPIKKEMLFNEVEKPRISMYQQPNGTNDIFLFDSDYLKWDEAESKVIFTEAKKLGDELFLVHIGGGHYENLQFINDRCMSFDSLGELAELSDGDINLKNVEI